MLHSFPQPFLLQPGWLLAPRTTTNKLTEKPVEEELGGWQTACLWLVEGRGDEYTRRTAFDWFELTKFLWLDEDACVKKLRECDCVFLFFALWSITPETAYAKEQTFSWIFDEMIMRIQKAAVGFYFFSPSPWTWW